MALCRGSILASIFSSHDTAILHCSPEGGSRHASSLPRFCQGKQGFYLVLPVTWATGVRERAFLQQPQYTGPFLTVVLEHGQTVD